MPKILIGIVAGAILGSLMGYFGKCTSGTCPLTSTPWRGAIYGAFMGLLFSLVFTAKPDGKLSNSSSQSINNEKGNSMAEHFDKDSFQKKVLQSDGVCLVDFYSDSCPPCRALAPTIEKLAADYAGKAVIGKVNCDTNYDLAVQYNITAIPAVLIFQNGKVVEKLIGLQPEAQYKAALDKLL